MSFHKVLDYILDLMLLRGEHTHPVMEYITSVR